MRPRTSFRHRLSCLVLLLLAAASPAAYALDTTLVAAGSVWKYRDNGSDQGTAWRAAAFNDSTWASGPAQLGYGDGDEATVVSYGPDPNQKYVTTYFRRSFNVSDPGAFNSLNLETKRDDGAVVYLNGVEVWRSNMPATWNYLTLAAADAGNSESQFVSAAINVSNLVAGTNVLAVEIHQNDRASSDISFDLRLIASTDAPFALLTRGPYLQMGTPSSVRVRWRTDLATDSRVRYGSSPTALTSVASLPAVVTDHEVALTGLNPATRYYYSVGSSSQVVAGGDSAHYFVTSPLVGAAAPTRIWVLGDSGTANNDARAVRDAYFAYAGSTHTNLWLMLGDNAYTYGTDEDYQWAVFDMYPAMLRKSVLWPTIGNHDTAEVPSAPPSLPYFAMFSLPTAGEAGGVPSGTEKYYSFDYGNIHFVCLDSMVSDRSPTGPMLTWLQNDLESTSQQWIIAFFHHPPYSKGSHDSDEDLELTEMRQNALPILEGYGVDLVLSGHSHSYERSFLLDSHYGFSTSLISSMKKDPGNGRVDGTGPYEKSTPGLAPHEGAVYVVAGSSGLVQAAPLNHPAMYIGLTNLGSMVLDVNGNRLDAKFLRENGVVADYFTIIKGAVDAPSTLSATAVSATRIDLQWTDASNNEDGFRIERCTGTAATCNANPASFALLTEAAANATTYSDTTAAASTTYSYRVRAFNSAASSTYTNTAAATTPAAPQPPAAPSALTATPVSTTQVNLAWTDNATNEDGFRVERCTGTWTACEENTAMFTQVAQLAANTTSYPDTGRTPGETYTYRVRAFNAAGNSAYTASEEVTLPAPPPAPATLAATAISTTQINLTWGDFTTSEEGFRVERCTGTAATCDANPASYAQIAQLAANTTSYPDTGLTAGTTYTYRVRAFNSAGGNSPYSNSASATTPAPPSAPTTLAATAISTTQVNLTWTDTSATEDGFRVERCTGSAATCDANPASYAQIAQLAANTTSYPDTGLTAGTTYTYRVRAFNTAGGNSPYSNSASATTPAPPSAPTTLAATAISTTQINLTWTDTASNEDGFRVERCTGTAATCDANPASYAQIAQLAANTTSYPDTGLTAGTTYTYRVRAFNTAGGNSPYSNSASATTPAPPSAPNTLAATAISTTQINLTWTDTASTEDGFRVERCTGTAATCDANPASYAQIAQLAANTTSYPDTGLTAGTTYTYRVRAYNTDGGNSPYSNSASATTPAPPSAPTGLAATAISTTQINLTWTDTASNEDGFRVERCTGTAATCDANPGSYGQMAQLAANTTSYADTGRNPGTTYTYRVRAYNTDGGNSPYSNSASATTPAPPSAPASLTATATSATQINLAWTDTSANEEGFRVERCTGTAAACASGTFTQVALLGSNATSYANTGLTGGTTYTYRVVATSSNGDSAPSNTASATTPVACTPVTITAQPQSTTITSGSSTTLSVTAAGTAPFSYQWYTGASGNTASPMAGSTSATLTVSPTTTTSYWVRITNGCGTVDSNAATVTVTPPPVTTTRGDFNLDGKADLFWRHTSAGASFIWFMNGSTFTQTAASAAPAPWAPEVFADFNGDGRADILWRQPNTGETSVWLMNGATYTSAVRTPTMSDTNWKPVGSGDFNGDGKADLFWRNSATGINTIWMMDGATVTQVAVARVPATWDVALTGDLNADGKADLFWRDRTTGETSIWLMNGAVYSTAVRSTTVTDLNWSPVAGGDFDGDGKYDLFWRNRATGQTSIWLMNGTAVRSVNASITVPVSWAVRGAGDYNADGKADLFWWNGTTGETSVWLMNGAAAPATVRMATVSTSYQPVLGR